MLADLLEKKSNPPVQVVQMGAQINAPTIQITETGQIVQVKTETNPVLQINADTVQQNPYFHIKNEQGQIIQLKSDQLQGVIQFKDSQSILQSQMMPVITSIKSEKDQIIETVVTDHSYTEPPMKKQKIDDKSEVFIFFFLIRTVI